MPVTVREEAHCTEQCAGKEVMQLEQGWRQWARENRWWAARMSAQQPNQLAWHHAQVPLPQLTAAKPAGWRADRLAGLAD
jgi:hypothetical protein